MSDTDQTPEATPASTTVAEPKSRKRKITPAKWGEIERAWTHGKFATLADLSAHFGVVENSLAVRFKERKIRRGSVVDEYNRQVLAELENQAKADAKLLAARIKETREEHYQMAHGISKMTWAEVLTAKKNGTALSTTKANLSALESAMKVLKMAREERFAVLGLNDDGGGDEDDSLPELVINELNQEQIDEMRARDTSTEDADGAIDTGSIELLGGGEGE